MAKQTVYLSIFVISTWSTGCSRGVDSEVANFDPTAVTQLVFSQFDKNNDGQLAKDELREVPGLLACSAGLDKNRDGSIGRDELQVRLDSYRQSSKGLADFECEVTMRGKPLHGALVRLEPESFLSEHLPPASGKTDDSGYCWLQSEGVRSPGVYYGMYRVRISSEQEKLPAKYNTASQLGLEVIDAALGSRGDTTGRFYLGP